MPSVNNYNEFGKLLKQVIKAGDTEIADRLLTHLYPFLSADDQDEVRTDILGHALMRGSLPIKQLFIQRLGLSPEAAYEYIKDCLENPEKDRDLLDDAAQHLEQFYGVLQVGAVIKGDLEIAETLLKHKPDRDIVIDYSNLVNYQILIDGEECWFQSEYMHEISSRQLKRVYSILDQAGLRDLFDHKTPLFGEGNFKHARLSTRSSGFKGTLPILTDGVLTHPELFLAFAEQKSQSAFGKVYDKIPCWIKDVEHEISQQVIKFKKDQHLFHKPMKKELAKLSDADLQELEHHKTLGVRLGLTFENDATVGLQANTVTALIKNMLPLHLQCGFNTPPGYVLAIMDLDYLAQFGANGFTSENMALARDFAEQFFPAPVLFNAYTHKSLGMSDGEIGVNSYESSLVFACLSDNSMVDGLLEVIPTDVWKNLFSSCSYKLGATELLKAKELFGFTSLDSPVSVTLRDVLVLHAAGYIFEGGENTQNVRLSADQSEMDANPHIVAKYIQMGGWPSSLPRPVSMEEAMSLAVKRRKDPIYTLYLRSVGVEESLKAASTPAQYMLVLELFSSAEVNPHLKLLPKNLRGKHLEDVMGL